MMETGTSAPETVSTRSDARARPRLEWLWHLLLIAVLLIGFNFRFTGLDWDQNQHLHPDERFLTMVETSIQPVQSLNEYFDTEKSSLNPHNRGYGFFVYGTLPIFLTRYVGEWLGQTGYDQIHLVGRQLSTLMDLGVVLLVYLIALRLYRRPPLALLAAALAAFSVLPIQLSHYFTVDTFTNFFGMLAFYFAVWLLPNREDPLPPGPPAIHPNDRVRTWLRGEWRSAVPYLLFGTALGMAMACKINAVFLAVLLPGAALIRFLSHSPADRQRWLPYILRNLAAGALVSLIFFRIFQPYAFSGPGFWGFMPNEKWVQNLRDLAAQSTGDVDFPPALQWARRPIWFALQNMVLWGLGLPLGILAWAGFVWMVIRVFKGEWRAHLLIWGWTALYFAYQSYNWTRSMRYQMLVYPTLAVIAAWAVFRLGENWARGDESGSVLRWRRPGAVAVGLVVLALTAAWAFAFTRIYTRPVTRVEASRWIYQNVPGPINLKIDTDGGLVNQPVAFRSGYTLQSEAPLVLAFQPRTAGSLAEVHFEHLVSPDIDVVFKTLTVSVSERPDGVKPFAVGMLADEFRSSSDPRGSSYQVNLNSAALLDPGSTYYLILDLVGEQRSLNLAGPVTLSLSSSGEGMVTQWLPEPVAALRSGSYYQSTFEAVQSGKLAEVVLDHVVDWEGWPEDKVLRVSILDPASSNVLREAEVSAPFLAAGDVRGESYAFRFSQAVPLEKGQTYAVRLEVMSGPGALAVYGSKQANESSWDDALPVGLDGYNPYDYQLGIYRSDLNFEMYWDDNADKLQRFLTNLDQADYIFISSNRQWGTTTRVPERYPLTSEYYRQLLGCPAEKEIPWCYSVAEPGMFAGALGFDLVKVVQSDPNLGGLRFNTQFAEEAFTVYDHPKVLIFQKTGDYNPERVRSILGAVDLSTVVHLTPRKASSYPGNLMLPSGRLAQQRSGGTWVDLFKPDAAFNRYPGLAAAWWYLVIAVLGWVVFPFTRLALRGLPDRGYPLARTVGLLVLAYPVWLLGSFGVAFTPLTISLVFLALLAANLVLAYHQRQVLLAELRERGRYILLIEALMLAFFLLFLLVRLGNPDLWHPWKGGEKPMDFSYFNAVLKSTTFPPYDPWFAGGYINYYYYGFVLVGVVVKWLGIVPSIAYNLILPTMFAILALGAFSVGWNLLAAQRRCGGYAGNPHFGDSSLVQRFAPFFGGLFAALASVVLGNWGTVRMIWHGLQKLSSMQVPFEQANFFTRITWTINGFWRLITLPNMMLPYGRGDWYWIPSRAIPGEPITEFPAFTFLYADLHAHMIALPVTVLALSWALSVLLGRWDWKGWGHLIASFVLGGLAVGALWPTNTWDWPTYLAIGCVAIVYTVLRYGQASFPIIPGVNSLTRRILIAAAAVIALVVLSALLYQPYSQWYGQGYGSIEVWKGDHTPFWSYLTHWGVFLFVIVSWMAWESIDWMARTPISELNQLRPYRGMIQLAAALLVILVGVLLALGVRIGWLVLPLAAWAGVLLLRPGMPDAKRGVLFLIGTALVLTLFVEVAVLVGDIGRMNTVFKFYLQAWTLLAASAAASLVWLLPAMSGLRKNGWRTAWQISLAILVAGAAMFPLLAGADKITDRMTSTAPHTLDGMTYMAYSTYNEGEYKIDLSEDYRAIQWMQRNVKGSPVIVEANVPEYRWGNRYTIYTGLPGVVGWNWHQRQQRAVNPSEWVTNRVDAVGEFYNTTSQEQAQGFLQRYDVHYIVVGQLEQAVYSERGLAKFAEWNGSLWNEVYRDGRIVIYQVMQP
jgi:YYY domain-containing protein